MEFLLNIATGILIPAVLAVGGWLAKLARDVNDLRVHLAEKYVSQEFMSRTFEPIRQDVEYLKKMLVRVADKLHVPTDD
jgi:hypothetical protein